MIVLTGSLDHPGASSINLPAAYYKVVHCVVRELKPLLIWSADIWATVEDHDAGDTAIANDGGSMVYDDEVTIDAQLQPAIIAGDAGGTADCSNLAVPA